MSEEEPQEMSASQKPCIDKIPILLTQLLLSKVIETNGVEECLGRQGV